MNNSLVVGYRHTGIIVKDMEKSLSFYRDILGLTVIQDYCDDSPYINKITDLKNANVHMIKLQAEDGTVTELLEYLNHPTELIQQEIINVGACHICYRVNNANEAYERLLSKNIPLISEPELSSEKIGRVFFALDPNGIRIELVEIFD